MLNKTKTTKLIKNILNEDTSYTPIKWLKDTDGENWCRFSVDNLDDPTLRKLLDNFDVHLGSPMKQPEDAEEMYFEVQICEEKEEEDQAPR